MLCSSARSGMVVFIAAATLAICAFSSPTVEATATRAAARSKRNFVLDERSAPLRMRRAEDAAANDDAGDDNAINENDDAVNDDGYYYYEEEEEEEEEEEVNLGYITPMQCVAYTVALGDDQYETERMMGISVVGLESFMFFEYVIPYQEANDDAGEYENDDQDNQNKDQDENEDNNNRRNLEEYVDENNYDSYFGQNVLTAKQWLTAFDNDGSTYGCTPFIDPTGVFQNYVQALNDGKLSFSTLYYGPVCSSDNSSSNSTAFFEMGVFLDSHCTAYVPGLSQILNEKIVSEWSTGVNVKESDSSASLYYSTETLYNYDGDFVNDCWSSDYRCDLKTLDSTQTTIQQFNYYHNRDDTDCQTYPEICELVFEASVDLNTCEFLKDELEEEEDSKSGDNNYDNDDEAIQEYADDYGEVIEIVYSVMKEGEEEEEDFEDIVEAYYYQMFQEVIVDYLEFTVFDTWYAGGDDANNEDAEDAYNEESNEGICYGLLASASKGYTLGKWLNDNSRQLKYELNRVYQLDTPSYALWYGIGTLVALCTLILIFAIVCGFRSSDMIDPEATNTKPEPPPPAMVPSGSSKSDALLGGPPPKRNQRNPVKKIRQGVEVLLNKNQGGTGMRTIDKGSMA